VYSSRATSVSITGEQAATPPVRLARALAWAAIAGQLVFTAAWVVAGALQPGYSHIEQAVSELGARNASHPWLMNAGLVVLGLSVAGLGPAVTAVLPRRRASRVAAWLFVAAGASIILAGLFQMDCGMTQQACLDRFHAGQLSWHHDLHLWASLAFDVALVGTPFAISRSLWPAPSGLLALACGTSGVAFAVIFFILARPEVATAGLAQRAGLGVVHLWVLIVAVGVLYSTRTEREPEALTPLSPRRFFAGAWRGPGELVPFPHFIWRRFPLRFEARREFTWFSDEAWLMDDVATFRSGRVERRRRFFHLVEPGRVHVTADDAPDGMDILLEEGGYRLTSYKFVVPVGPLRFALSCRDTHELAADGTLIDTMRLSWHGLPVARITIRARPAR
jgi:hypothetical membrane protein